MKKIVLFILLVGTLFATLAGCAARFPEQFAESKAARKKIIDDLMEKNSISTTAATHQIYVVTWHKTIKDGSATGVAYSGYQCNEDNYFIYSAQRIHRGKGNSSLVAPCTKLHCPKQGWRITAGTCPWYKLWCDKTATMELLHFVIVPSGTRPDLFNHGTAELIGSWSSSINQSPWVDDNCREQGPTPKPPRGCKAGEVCCGEDSSGNCLQCINPARNQRCP